MPGSNTKDVRDEPLKFGKKRAKWALDPHRSLPTVDPRMEG